VGSAYIPYQHIVIQSQLWTVAGAFRIVSRQRTPVAQQTFNHADLVCRDGTVIASASTDGLCRLWDLRTGKLLRTLLLPDASRPFTSVQFSPNGRFLSAVDDSGGFNVWDWRKESGTVVRQFKGHTGCVEAQFIQDKHAIAISRDSHFDIWNLESSKVGSEHCVALIVAELASFTLGLLNIPSQRMSLILKLGSHLLCCFDCQLCALMESEAVVVHTGTGWLTVP
jgi:WD40 repeat protein